MIAFRIGNSNSFCNSAIYWDCLKGDLTLMQLQFGLSAIVQTYLNPIQNLRTFFLNYKIDFKMTFLYKSKLKTRMYKIYNKHKTTIPTNLKKGTITIS